jgi:predicted TIM-barrel fold metal-dependent hydrolase
MELMYRGKASKAELSSVPQPYVEPLADRPEYQSREPRLRRLDEQGVEACWLFPTMVSGVEEVTADDLDVTYALLDALNRYLLDEWQFGVDGRIFCTPVVSLADPARAVTQLEFAIEHGARGVMVRPAPVPAPGGRRSPAGEDFDRFWARAAEAEVVVLCHAADTGYHRYAGDWTGNYEMQPYRKKVPMHEWIYIEGRAPSDFILSLIVQGTFARNPQLKVMSVESGAFWVPPLLHSLKKYHSHYPEQFPGDPVEQFASNVWISPFWEDDIVELARHIPVERIVAGSDWPHPEGLAEPSDFVAGLAGFSAADQRRILRENGLSLVQ